MPPDTVNPANLFRALRLPESVYVAARRGEVGPADKTVMQVRG